MAKRLNDSQIKKLTPAELAKLKATQTYKLPAKYLTPAQQAIRSANYKKNQQAKTDALEIVPGSGLTLGSLKKQLQTEEQLQYSGTDAEYAQQRTQLAANQNRDSGWFDTYRQNVLNQKTKLDQQNTDYNTANEAVASSQETASRAANQAQATEMNDASRQLNLGGLQGQDFLAKANAATESRATALRSQAMAAAERARGNSAMLDASATGADAAKGDALARYLSANVGLDRKTDVLNKDKASFRQKILEKAIADADQRVQTENVLKATMAKDAGAQAIASQKATTDSKYKQAMIDIALKQLGINQQKADQSGSGSGGGGKKKGSKPLRSTAPQVQAMSNRIDRLARMNWSRKPGVTVAKLRKSGHYTDLEIDVMNDMIYKHGVTSANIKRLHAQGYKLADFPRLRPYRKAK
jgi:hypothetical protein